MATSVSRRLFGTDGDLIGEREAQCIFLAHAIVVTGTVLLSPLIADLAVVFTVSEAEAGLFIVVFTGTLLFTLPVAGMVADRVGRRSSVGVGVALFGLAGAAIALVDSFAAALGLRAMQAIGVALSKPVLVALLGDLYTGSRETTAQGIRVGVDSVVQGAVPIAAGLLFVVSWRAPFLLYLLAVPAAVWLWAVLPSAESDSSQSLRTYVRELASFVGGGTTNLLMISFFVRHFLLYATYTYVSVLAIREAGMAVVMVGALLGARSVAKFVSSTQAGRIVNRTDVSLVSLGGFGLIGLGLVLMGIIPTPIMLFAGIVVFGFGDGFLSPTQKSLVNRLTAPDQRSGSMAAAMTFQNVGKTVGPLAVGVLLGFVGPATSFVLFGGLGGLAGIALLFLIWVRTR